MDALPVLALVVVGAPMLPGSLGMIVLRRADERRRFDRVGLRDFNGWTTSWSRLQVRMPVHRTRLVLAGLHVRDRCRGTTPRSRRAPKSWLHAWMTAFCASEAESFESMKSTMSLRPAIPPWALMYLAKPSTPATEPAKSPGSTVTLTSATTAIRNRGRGDPDLGGRVGAPAAGLGPDLVALSPPSTMPSPAAIRDPPAASSFELPPSLAAATRDAESSSRS